MDALTSTSHPTHELFEALKCFDVYPPGVVAVPSQIQGTSFFPGGIGLWRPSGEPLPDLPIQQVMVLGHDFHSFVEYEKSLRRGHESLTAATWRSLNKFLGDASIPPTSCFFTNYFMGLREGLTTTGRFPGANDSRFVEHCGRFLLRQLALVQPRLVLVLGAHVPRLLASLSPELQQWRTLDSFWQRDKADSSVVRASFQTGADSFSSVVVSLVHPSLRSANIRHRRWRTFAGHAAEISMTRHAVELAGIVTGNPDR